MLKNKLANFRIILASGSPRRQELLQQLDIPFVSAIKEIEESYPEDLQAEEITEYLSQKKAEAFRSLQQNEILITSDTLVWHEDQPMGKPKGEAEAKIMLQKLSGHMHKVITSVCLTTTKEQTTRSDATKVWFNKLTREEIEYYVHKYKPIDKAGAYGIQEWIGLIGVRKIEGSYFNVVGFPTHLLYRMLQDHLTSQS